MNCQVCGDEIEGNPVSGQGYWACSTSCIQKLEEDTDNVENYLEYAANKSADIMLMIIKIERRNELERLELGFHSLQDAILLGAFNQKSKSGINNTSTKEAK